MTLDHVAIWTNHLEQLKDYYVRHFNGNANEKYTNRETLFESYFITFDTGSRIEIMNKPSIPENLNDRVAKQHLGLIHLAFEVETMEQVSEKARELAEAGFKIIRGPRKTGDGYFEFETLDPDDNRVEVITRFAEKNL
jgi:lactoylglutathione lyase